MLISYFKIAWRFLVKNKLYSFINIAGLSLGLACAMLMILYVKDEFTFDRFHKNADRIYRIGVNVRNPDGSSMDRVGAAGIFQGPVFQESVPGVESFVRMNGAFHDIRLQGEIYSQRVFKADTNFFTFFSFPLLHGNPRTALEKKNSLVITEEVALRHFGNTDALGKEILFENNGHFVPCIITGVAKSVPQNSTIQFEMLTPLDIPAEAMTVHSWNDLSVATFVRLAEGNNSQAVVNRMQRVFEKEAGEAISIIRSAGFQQTFVHMLEPLLAVHLSQDFPNDSEPANRSKPVYSYILSGIAIFVLLIACVNFVNHTIARSAKRAKEIGVRKVVGGNRKQLIAQFLGESFLLASLSFLGAMLLAQVLLPFFNEAVNKDLALGYLLDGELVLYYGLLYLATALIDGFYPALILSGYRPVQILYQQFRLSGKSRLQQGLIVFQFAIATVMVVATVTIYRQFNFLTSTDLGYDATNVIQVRKKNLTVQEAKRFREELLKDPSIVEASPLNHSGMNGKVGVDSIHNFAYDLVSEEYFELLRIQKVQGRYLNATPADSANAAMVNETFVKLMGWKDPLGKQVDVMPFDGIKRTIVGVVKDYHFNSLKQAIGPQMLIPTTQAGEFEAHYNKMLVRIQPNSEARATRHIENVFKQLFPIVPYTFQFYSDINFEDYRMEANWRKVILLGAGLTLFVAGIGLFGLSILEAERRFKEIGIRKVLGATVKAIVQLLLRDLLVLISIALVVALPVSWYVSDTWLEMYPYRTEVSIWAFGLVAILVIIVGFCTIAYQSIKAARMNPVNAIKRD